MTKNHTFKCTLRGWFCSTDCLAVDLEHVPDLVDISYYPAENKGLGLKDLSGPIQVCDVLGQRFINILERPDPSSVNITLVTNQCLLPFNHVVPSLYVCSIMMHDNYV